MSKFTKSQLAVDGNSVHMSMPFAKVDKEHRLVSGFATLDNVDTQGDVVLAEASAKAFARARGNIREMHQPIAAGKIVDFREEEFYDDGNFYRGIFVTAYVSEGAEDTWKKVLDGTLTGFSIGGEINEASNEFVKEYGKTVRFIKDYDLTELSLVDNPANQLANVFSIQKSVGGGMMVKGMVSETFIENVFVCKNDETVIVKDSAKEDCPLCGAAMENAGWFESGENRVNKVNAIVSDFWNPAEMEAAPNPDSEGGVEMGKKDEVTKSEAKPEEVEEETPTVEEEEATEAPEEETEEVEAAEVSEADETEEEEEAAEVEEVEDDETEIAKRIDELHEAVKDSLEKTRNETSERVAELEQKIEKATEDFLSKANEIESKITGLVDNIETQKARVAALESRIEKINSSDAVKKSADLEKSAVKNVQSDTSWNGAFSGRRSSFSVDDL